MSQACTHPITLALYYTSRMIHKHYVSGSSCTCRYMQLKHSSCDLLGAKATYLTHALAYPTSVFSSRMLWTNLKAKREQYASVTHTCTSTFYLKVGLTMYANGTPYIRRMICRLHASRKRVLIRFVFSVLQCYAQKALKHRYSMAIYPYTIFSLISMIVSGLGLAII